jgi:hypothetical protein
MKVDENAVNFAGHIGTADIAIAEFALPIAAAICDQGVRMSIDNCASVPTTHPKIPSR